MTPFPISSQSPITHPGPPPTEADVVVIGGGIIGVMTVWELAKRGLRAVLVEKGRIAGEQSSRNWGWIRAQGRDIAELPIALEALEMWPELAKTTDIDIGLRQTGTLYLAQNTDELDRYEAWLSQARPFGVSSKILTKPQVSEMIPATVDWAGALYTPTDMRAEPWVTVPAFARAATRDGAIIVEGCAARLIDVQAGQVAGVITEHGRIKAPAVVVAGGAWSSLLLQRHGIDIPQLSVIATAAATAPLDLVYPGGAVDNQLAFRRREDGGYTLASSNSHGFYIGRDAFRHLRKFLPQMRADPFGTKMYPFAPRDFPDAWGTTRHWTAEQISPFEKMRVLNPKPNARRIAKMANDFAACFPQLGLVNIQTAWAGMIDTMPDVVPVVDVAKALPGLTIATGMSGHGFGIGPAFGKIAASLAVGDAPGHDISRFRLSRFSDGSQLVMGPTL